MAPSLSISIPRTSICTPTGSKPYTQYAVVLQLPLRKQEVLKRYSDFVQLHANLVAQVGAPPPSPLPGKSWFKRTIGNDAYTEERRAALQQYIHAIVESEDARWRSSTAWRSFLGLPTGDETHSSATAKSSLGNPSTAAAYIDPSQWLDGYRDLKTQMQSVRHLLKQRELATTAQQQHALSADAKANLVRAATSIAHLEDGLQRMTDSRQDDTAWAGGQKLGDGEIRRRRDLIRAAKSEVEGLDGVLKSVATRNLPPANGTAHSAAASDGDKAALWQGTTTATQQHKGRVLGGPAKETERTRPLDNAGVLQLQQQIMREQDEDVLSLGQTVAKLKDMGLMINEELTIQNEMLGLLEEDTDRVQAKVDVARRRIGKIR